MTIDQIIQLAFDKGSNFGLALLALWMLGKVYENWMKSQKEAAEREIAVRKEASEREIALRKEAADREIAVRAASQEREAQRTDKVLDVVQSNTQAMTLLTSVVEHSTRVSENCELAQEARLQAAAEGHTSG